MAETAAARLSHASNRLATVAKTAAAASSALAALQEQHARRQADATNGLIQKVAEPLKEADIEAARTLSKLRSPPQLVQLIVRCACTLVSVDLPGFAQVRRPGRPPALLTYDDAKKILARSDLDVCLKRFNLGRLAKAMDVAAMVAPKAQWQTAALDGFEPIEGGDSSSGLLRDAGGGGGGGGGNKWRQAVQSAANGVIPLTDPPTFEQARASHAAAGALFTWVARVLASLREAERASLPSSEAKAAMEAVEEEVVTRESERVAIAAEVKLLEEAAAEEARVAAEEKRRQEAERRRAEEAWKKAEAEKRRLEEEEQKRRAEEERLRKEEERRQADEEERRQRLEALRLIEEKKRRRAEEEKRREEEERRRAEEERRRVEEERRQAELVAQQRAEAERRKRQEAARVAAEEEACVIAAEAAAAAAAETAAAETAAAEEEIRLIEQELAEAEDTARRAEEREAARERARARAEALTQNRRASFAAYLRSETSALESALDGIDESNAGAAAEAAETLEKGDAAEAEAEERRRSHEEAQLIREVEEAAIGELMALLPSAGRERCRRALEERSFDVEAAACDVLCELSISPDKGAQAGGQPRMLS